MMGITLGPATGEALAPLVLDGHRVAEIEPLGLERFARRSRTARQKVAA